MINPVPHITQQYDDMSACQCGATFLLRSEANTHRQKTKHSWVKRTKRVIDPKYRYKIDKLAYSMPEQKDYWEVEE